MLQKLSEIVGDCLLRAADARQHSEIVGDPRAQADWLRQEATWSSLARSFAFSESLDRFLDVNREFRTRWQKAATAPFHRDIELAVIDRSGTNAFVSPCRRTAQGWVDANSGRALDFVPTHWREWREPGKYGAARRARARSDATTADDGGGAETELMIFDEERIALRIERVDEARFALVLRVDGEELTAGDLDANALATIARRLLGAVARG